MRHGNYLSHFYGEWTIIFFIGAVLALLVGIIWLIHRRTTASDDLPLVEGRKHPSLEREVLSMLRQNGGPVNRINTGMATAVLTGSDGDTSADECGPDQQPRP
jgi:hypothetical protein